MRNQIDLVTAVSVEKWYIGKLMEQHEEKLRELREQDKALDTLITRRGSEQRPMLAFQDKT